MDARAKPTRLPVLLEADEVSANRRFLCPDYEECLTFAMRNRWPSWTCRECPRVRAELPATAAVTTAPC
jgi:hypothetical protein